MACCWIALMLKARCWRATVGGALLQIGGEAACGVAVLLEESGSSSV
jgi:hypothetical protein